MAPSKAVAVLIAAVYAVEGRRIHKNLGSSITADQASAVEDDAGASGALAKAEAVLGACGQKGSASSLAETSAKTMITKDANATGPADHDIDAAIVNGDKADHCAWKWQVGLRKSLSQMPFCGGMLIDSQWVLSAGHCMGDPVFMVTAGEWVMSQDSGHEQSRNALQVIKHPHYSSDTMHYDLALVKLDRPFTLGGCIGTVCLPAEGQDVQPGTKCWITGWGTLRSQGSQPDTLQEAEVTTISNEDCVKDYDYTVSHLHDSMLCAQGRTPWGTVRDACQGDSGGPLVCESTPGTWTLYGATSWGFGCAGENYPGIWSRVHEGLGWIYQVTNGNSNFIPPTPAPPSCPAAATASSPTPDSDGDCYCPLFKYCSADGGKTKNCPRSLAVENTLFKNAVFSYTCEECSCHWIWTYRKTAA